MKLDDLISSGTATGDWSCTPVTDYWSFYNRQITVGAVTINDTWGQCSPCIPAVPGCTDVNATNYDPNATTDDETHVLTHLLQHH